MIKIDGKNIGSCYPPYIIAELSANHNGSLELAKKTIIEAKKSGASAIKLQTYNANSMTINSSKEDFIIKDGLWKGYKLFDLYNEASTPYEWHKELFQFAQEIGITIFSSPFDENAVDLLDDLNTPAFKIASFEITDLPLIKYIAKKRKPILISTGMASLEEIHDAVETAKTNGCDQLLLFHCISSYPTLCKDANVRRIKLLKKEFGTEIGLSDHTLTNTASIASIAFGAVAIEKHFILDRSQKGPDSTFSIEPDELASLVKSTHECWEALGSEEFKRPLSEKNNLIFRRSLYFVKDLKKGDLIKKSDIRRIRPGYGLKPKYLKSILNKRVNKDIQKGDRVNWNVISN